MIVTNFFEFFSDRTNVIDKCASTSFELQLNGNDQKISLNSIRSKLIAEITELGQKQIVPFSSVNNGEPILPGKEFDSLLDVENALFGDEIGVTTAKPLKIILETLIDYDNVFCDTKENLITVQLKIDPACKFSINTGLIMKSLSSKKKNLASSVVVLPFICNAKKLLEKSIYIDLIACDQQDTGFITLNGFNNSQDLQEVTIECKLVAFNTDTYCREFFQIVQKDSNSAPLSNKDKRMLGRVNKRAIMNFKKKIDFEQPEAKEPVGFEQIVTFEIFEPKTVADDAEAIRSKTMQFEVNLERPEIRLLLVPRRRNWFEKGLWVQAGLFNSEMNSFGLKANLDPKVRGSVNFWEVIFIKDQIGMVMKHIPKRSSNNLKDDEAKNDIEEKSSNDNKQMMCLSRIINGSFYQTHKKIGKTYAKLMNACSSLKTKAKFAATLEKTCNERKIDDFDAMQYMFYLDFYCAPLSLDMYLGANNELPGDLLGKIEEAEKRLVSKMLSKGTSINRPSYIVCSNMVYLAQAVLGFTRSDNQPEDVFSYSKIASILSTYKGSGKRSLDQTYEQGSSNSNKLICLE